MNKLILDCSCGMNVYVVSDNNIFSVEDKTQNKHSDEILKVVDDLLIQSGLKIKDINNICVCVGPGSFTGVRVAVSVVKGLAIGINAKVFVLSNFDIYSVDSKNYCLVLDGFSSFVYARTMINGVCEDSCIEVEKLVDKLKENNLEVFSATEKTQKLLEKFKINAKILSNKIISAFNDEIQKNKPVQLNQIYPVYLRASQAEIEREKKK